MGAVASKGGKRADKALWMDESRDCGFWEEPRGRGKTLDSGLVYITKGYHFSFLLLIFIVDSYLLNNT